MTLAAERTAGSLRLSAPGLGLGMNEQDIDEYLAMVDAGVIIPETACDKGMQDDFAMRPSTTVPLPLAIPVD